MSWANSELEREMDNYEVHGPAIYSSGRDAGNRGLNISDNPHPSGHWTENVWNEGWHRGHLGWLSNKAPLLALKLSSSSDDQQIHCGRATPFRPIPQL